MHYLSKNLLSSFNPSVFDVNVVYDLPMCLAAMQAGRGERRPENAKGNGHFSRNPPSPCDAIPTLGETLSSLALSENFFAVFLADGDERGRRKNERKRGN